MAELQGYAAKGAYKKATTWGTAVLITAATGDQFEYASETVVPDVVLIDSDQITGEALTGASSTGAINVVGDVAGQDLVYQGKERWFRDVFGEYGDSTSAGGPTLVNTTVQRHKFDFHLSNEGRFGTLIFDKAVSVHETDSYKPMGLTLTGTAGNFVKLTVSGIGRRVLIGSETPDDRVNLTFPANALPTVARHLARFGHVSIKLGALGTAPGAMTAFCVSGFEFNFTRNADPTPTTCDGDYSSEPATDTVEITGSLDFPIYDTDNDPLVLAQLTKGSKALYASIDSGVVITGSAPSTNFKIEIYIPGLQFTTGWPSVAGRGRVPVSLAWRAHVVAVADAQDTDAVLPRVYIDNLVANIDDYQP